MTAFPRGMIPLLAGTRAIARASVALKVTDLTRAPPILVGGTVASLLSTRASAVVGDQPVLTMFVRGV
jgi:hypothetical protein